LRQQRAAIVSNALNARVLRAVELVDAHAYIQTPGSVFVYSDAPGVAGHTVADGLCDCPDSTLGEAARLLGGRCKHRLVVEFLEAVADEQHDAASLKRRLAAGSRLAAIAELVS
jgi:hypothetical protein